MAGPDRTSPPLALRAGCGAALRVHLCYKEGRGDGIDGSASAAPRGHGETGRVGPVTAVRPVSSLGFVVVVVVW